jgi:hypothetical protein
VIVRGALGESHAAGRPAHTPSDGDRPPSDPQGQADRHRVGGACRADVPAIDPAEDPEMDPLGRPALYPRSGIPGTGAPGCRCRSGGVTVPTCLPGYHVGTPDEGKVNHGEPLADTAKT